LASLGPINNVDRLEPGQPPIRFAVNGVTLIYGPNASGKSGYCRITKQLCRSLSPGVLRGNVYDEGEPAPAEVGVAFRVGGDDDSKTELTWRGNDPHPAELARISVFDTASARVYVDQERKIESLPYELDLLNKLGLAGRALDRQFREREDALNASVNTPLPAGYSEGTNAHEIVAKLIPATTLDDLPSEQELRSLAAWSEQDQADLHGLVEQSKNDPQTMARLRREARQALRALQGDIASIGENLGDTAIESLTRKQQDAATKNNAAEASAHDLFKGEPIPDVGSEVWRQMLGYAREFAAEVFPAETRPGSPQRANASFVCRTLTPCRRAFGGVRQLSRPKSCGRGGGGST
jgi:hypothetical protein